jgi:hypothetical protein
MLEAERARNAALLSFNAGKWPGQADLRWEDFSQPNPWPLLVTPVTVLPADAPAAARVALAASQRRRAPSLTGDGFEFRGIPSVERGWRLWAAPPGGFVANTSGLSALAPQGSVRRSFAVRPGDILRIQVTVGDELPGGNGATLAIRFPAAAPKPAPSAEERLHPSPPPRPGAALARVIRLVAGVNVLEVPVREAGGETAEVEISFVDRLPPIGLVEVERLPR